MNEHDPQHEQEEHRRSAWWRACGEVSAVDVIGAASLLIIVVLSIALGGYAIAHGIIHLIRDSMNIITPAETAAEREARVMASHFIACQQQFADDRSRLKVIEKSRQTGISYTEAYIAVDETSKAGAKRDSWVSSRDLTQARLFINDCKQWARRMKLAAKDRGERVLDVERDLKAFEIDFDTGKAIYSMSSNPDAQAGKRGRRTCDEFALHKDQRQMFAILQPGTMWGGTMTFISTHRGTNSFFNRELVQSAKGENKKKISLHTITIERAVRDGLWIKIKSQLDKDDVRIGFDDDAFLQSLRDECPDEETWLQEYCCIPSDDASALLTWEEIIACSLTPAERAAYAIPATARRSIGFDVARRKDLSVITTLADVAGIAVVEDVKVMKGERFSNQETRLIEEIERCTKLTGTRPRVHIDASGLGMQLAENMTTKFGESVVTGVMFTNASKQEIAFPLRARFQDRTIRISDDRLYTADLRSVKKEVSAAGNIIITSEAGATDGHADRFWSLALANFGFNAPCGSVAYEPLNDARDIFGNSYESDSETGLWLPRA